MFPGAVTDRESAAYVIVGAPLDVSTTFQPGTRFGPDRVRLFARSFEDYDHHTGGHFSELGVHDDGDLHAWDDAQEYLTFLGGKLSDIRNEGAMPILIGGEHTVSRAGVQACEPDVFVALDAHLDLRAEYDGNPSSHATVTHHALETAEEAIILGARTGDEAEWERASAGDVTVVEPDELSDWLASICDQSPVIDGSVYLSIDIDAADPSVAPGTGTMEPFGLGSWEMQEVVRTLAPACVGFDVVEVSDRDDGQAATLAGKLLRSFVYQHAAET
ncbi:agmatinase [Halocatena pleomorpha]|uniref:Agmatinase n=1 Tax=Halocatena pleomorpha TaxID=1785090 RepID=A0A3P3RFP5_9EURY|nr:agmatinase [Halocatena pleomorpha]RRJ32195.1 agmatinase [Halocatena pleomorpha]